jgi:hypothetical protein
VSFNYAGSGSKGGAALDLACAGCVAASEVSFTFATPAANTFAGTQTINAGNLDLDNSTAATGVLTKDGNRFLHNFGAFNTFLGASAGNFTMTGSGNTGVGEGALRMTDVGNDNTATGFGALERNTSGNLNTAHGYHALRENTLATDNTATGAFALRVNLLGNGNTATGSNALNENFGGNGNTATGFFTLNSNNGDRNVAVGYRAGALATTGANNIYLGADVQGTAGESNTMYLGRVGTQTKTFIAGVRGITTVNPNAIAVMIDSAGQLGTVSSSRRYKEDIRQMAEASRRLLQLRPVTFRYTRAFGDGSKPVQFGLIAEEVADVFPELVVTNAEGQPETVHYEKLNVLLLNELQEQQRRIELLERRLDELLRHLDTGGERSES